MVEEGKTDNKQDESVNIKCVRMLINDMENNKARKGVREFWWGRGVCHFKCCGQGESF